MYPEKAVVRVHGDLKVHTRFYPHPGSSHTVLLVNGSLATCAAFSQTLRYLRPLFNVVVYDQPYAGASQMHNRSLPMIGMEDEALILLDLIEHFRADQLLSFSWGGVSALLALAQRPARIQRAVIGSFSPVLSPAMLDYLQQAQQYLVTYDRHGIANLVNDTLGKHLPPAFKRHNFRHIASLEVHEYAQMSRHIRQVLTLDTGRYMRCVANVDVPLLFLNGELDEYTSPTDALYFADLARRSQYVKIRNTGHFLEMEHATAWEGVRQAVECFLLDEQQAPGLRRAG